MVIQVISAGFEAGNFAKITINDTPVLIEKNESNNHRGLHIIIINNTNGTIELAKCIDTYTSSDEFHRIITHNIPLGFIVIVACMDECVSGLSYEFKHWFANMGSLEIWELGFRRGFAFIGIFGKKTCSE